MPTYNTQSEKTTERDIAIEFLGITYGYSEKRILESASFKVFKGEKVALYANNGKGKSTIINIITRLICPHSGTVMIKGIKIDDYSDDILYHLISLMPQEQHLFHDTIETNLFLVSKSKYALESLHHHLQPLVLKLSGLENGLSTMVIDNGKNLSGGQAQLIGLVRTLLKESDIYIFDEPTASLDMATKACFFNLFDTLLKDKTVVYVTHNKEDLHFAESRYTIINGKIIPIDE